MRWGAFVTIAGVISSSVFFVECVGSEPTTGAAPIPDAGGGDTALADGPASPPDADATVDAGAPRIVSVAAGGSHACATRSDGTLVCWGQNSAGQLGLPLAGNGTCSGGPCRPPTVVPLTDVTGTCHGSNHTCAVKTDGTVWCFGANDNSQLGHDASTDSDCGGNRCNATPTKVVGVSGAKQLACNERATCARTDAGDVYCWGSNGQSLAGLDATTASTTTPNRIAFPEAVSDFAIGYGLASGGTHGCAVGASSAIYCWGSNAAGELGVPAASIGSCDGVAASCTKTPQKVMNGANPLTTADKVRVGIQGSCALLKDHSVWCWGSNQWMQMGIDPFDATEHAPTKVAALGSAFVTAVEAHYLVYAVIDSTKKITSWGRSTDSAAIGNGQLTGSLPCAFGAKCEKPVKLALPSDVAQVAEGRGFSVALTSTGDVWAWGLNGQAQLGHPEGTASDQTCSGTGCNPTPTRALLP